MHMYNYVYMHIGKYTDTQIRRKLNMEKKEIAEKRNEHAHITEMKCLNGVPCGLSLFLLAPWSGGVFTTNGLSFAMQLLDLHFLTMSR